MPLFDFSDRRNIQHGVLRAAPAQEVRESLLAYCEHIEQTDDVDFDEVMRVGMLIQVNPAGCDALLVDWLLTAPSPLRLDLVGAVLVGLWSATKVTVPVRADVVRRLTEWRPAVRMSPDADYTYSLVMNGVIDHPLTSEGLRELALERIKKIAMIGTGDASLDRSLLVLRSKNRKKLGRTGAAKTGTYRAYACSGDTDAKFVVEAANSVEIAQVLDLRHDEPNTLTIEYRKPIPELSNILVTDALGEALLGGLLEHKHRNECTLVKFVDTETRFENVQPYPS